MFFNVIIYNNKAMLDKKVKEVLKMKYSIFNDVLLKLRDDFHKNGRFDDSNTKLDEIVKLLVICFIDAKYNLGRFNIKYLEQRAYEETGNKENIAIALRSLFEEVAQGEDFYNNDGTNVFGVNPTLNIQITENLFARNLVLELGKIDFKELVEHGTSFEFDIINECFGHFVRDNFRNNKEDGQYMTPQEVAEPLLKMVLHDLIEDGLLESLIKNPEFIIMDPTCGVGTLMIEMLRNIIKYIQKSELDEITKDQLINTLKNKSIVGQDKVDRMVRLSKINLMLMDCNFSNIYHGNSIVGESPLKHYIGKADIIISNPPFGADYNLKEVVNEQGYSIIKDLEEYSSISSELLILDRCLGWLKPGGRLVIVLPDSVVSSKGISSRFREKLLEICDIKAIIELPAVAFAQAGTRTKTSIVYLQKKHSQTNTIFMSVCDSIGFDVKERKGVPVKVQQGHNEMNQIADIYISCAKTLNNKIEILNENPSCTKIAYHDIIDGFLTPSFYSSDRLKVLSTLKGVDSKRYNVVKLSDLASFVSKDKNRKRLATRENVKHISLLHINHDYTINFTEVELFDPISKGIECQEGDLLFAKLNPRIPRIAVVPPYDKKLVCSNEFEILKPKNGLSPYILNIILSMDLVKKQIESLTAGTSSSHNRIKTEQLKEIKIPFPKQGTQEYSDLLSVARITEECIQKKYEAEYILKQQKKYLSKLLCI